MPSISDEMKFMLLPEIAGLSQSCDVREISKSHPKTINSFIQKKCGVNYIIFFSTVDSRFSLQYKFYKQFLGFWIFALNSKKPVPYFFFWFCWRV